LPSSHDSRKDCAKDFRVVDDPRGFVAEKTGFLKKSAKKRSATHGATTSRRGEAFNSNAYAISANQRY
jgi:hypothetical protein